jgi:hypothetical protein
MEVPGHFRSPIIGICLMTQCDAIDAQLFMHHAAPICREARIMIADNPAPVITYGQLPQKPGGFILQPRFPTIVVEIVT